jgi:hypothetical protein
MATASLLHSSACVHLFFSFGTLFSRFCCNDRGAASADRRLPGAKDASSCAHRSCWRSKGYRPVRKGGGRRGGEQGTASTRRAKHADRSPHPHHAHPRPTCLVTSKSPLSQASKGGVPRERMSARSGTSPVLSCGARERGAAEAGGRAGDKDPRRVAGGWFGAQWGCRPRASPTIAGLLPPLAAPLRCPSPLHCSSLAGLAIDARWPGLSP